MKTGTSVKPGRLWCSSGDEALQAYDRRSAAPSGQVRIEAAMFRNGKVQRPSNGWRGSARRMKPVGLWNGSTIAVLLAGVSCIGPASAAEGPIAIEAGKSRVLPFARSDDGDLFEIRGSKKVGSRKTEILSQKVRIRPADQGPDDGSVSARLLEEGVNLSASPQAAGRQYCLTLESWIRVDELRKIPFVIPDGRDIDVRERLEWVHIGNRKETREHLVTVGLGVLPTILVPLGKSFTFSLPSSVSVLNIRGGNTSRASTRKLGDSKVVVLGKAVGETTFTIEYAIGQKKHQTSLRVKVVKDQQVLTVALTQNLVRKVPAGAVEELLNLRDPSFLFLDKIEDDETAQIEVSEDQIAVKAVKAGETSGFVTLTAKENKKANAKQCLTQVELKIVVKEKNG